MSISGSPSPSSSSFSCTPDTGPVTESNPLVSFLETLQKTALNAFGAKKFDPKRYVDFSLKPKFDLGTAREAFQRLIKSRSGSVSAQDLERYIDEYFNEAGGDLVYVSPADYSPAPAGFLPTVKNGEVRDWAFEVHSLWKNLSRKVSGDVSMHFQKHTLLPLPEPVVIPGSRFREVYYWDSYWVIRGLLASKMYETAKGIVTNLISLLDKYGHVLNGAREYYTNRSQPALLTAMVHAIYKWTGDMKFVRKALPALLREYQFWTSGVHQVTIQDVHGHCHNLSRYYAMWNKPRPESSTLDVELASSFSTACEKEHFYRELATAAESGWDFSTRWMRNHSDLTTLATTSIIPVDLNVFILGMELDIAFLAKETLDHVTANRFLKASQVRKNAISAVFWNQQKRQWLDYWLSTSTEGGDHELWKACNQNPNVFASNFMPLWMKPFHSDTSLVKEVMKSLQSSGLVCPAGIATSLTDSGQQWDFPNGWAPLQHMIIEGLASSNVQEAKSLAKEIAIRWIKTNFVAFKKTGVMHEKYDVRVCGGVGGGGEYMPQTGFGWSNGLVLALLEEFGWPEDMQIDDRCVSR